MHRMPLQTPERVDCIQLLRAIAAIAVVTHHIPLFENGAWGVDLFFVISGFIMCYVTEDSRDRFLAKRIIRVVPLYWSGTLGVFLLTLAAPHLLRHTTTSVPDLLKSLAFIPFQKGPDVQPVLFLGWTLNYEMFFYALFAISMSVSHRHRALICSTLFGVIVGCGHLVHLESVALKFFAHPIILEFALGMLSYWIFRATAASRAEQRISSRILWCLLGIGLLLWLPFSSEIVSTQSRLLRWGIPATLCFYSTVHGLSGITLPRGVVLLGDASFSLYLFHPYVIQLFDRVFGAFGDRSPRAYVLAVVAISLCLLLSVLVYKYLEKPVTERLRALFISGNVKDRQARTCADGPQQAL